MINLPNPWILDSAPPAETVTVTCDAPAPARSDRIIPERAETAVGVSSCVLAPAAFSFDPPPAFFDALYAQIMNDMANFHPRDLDLDPLSGASHADNHLRFDPHSISRRVRRRD